MIKALLLSAACGLLGCLLCLPAAHAQGPGPRPNAPETWYDGPTLHVHPKVHPSAIPGYYTQPQAAPPRHGGRAWFGYTREERKEFPVYYHGYRRYDGGFHASYYRNYPGYQQGVYNERYGYGNGWGW